MISICMLKICGDSILKPLELIFESYIESGKFPPNRKKQMLFQFIKNNKQLIQNYRPISLLFVCSKTLEWLIYNKMFRFFTENKLISNNKSGFKPGTNASINYYLSLTIFINHWVMASRQQTSFSTYERYLIKFCTSIFSTSCSEGLYQVTF